MKSNIFSPPKLLFSEPRLHDTYYVVAQFFALIDEVNVEGADSIAIFTLVHGADVFRLHLLAHLIDFVLYAVAVVDIVLATMAMHHMIHLCQRIIAKRHNGFQPCQLFFGQFLACFLQAVQCTC